MESKDMWRRIMAAVEPLPAYQGALVAYALTSSAAEMGAILPSGESPAEAIKSLGSAALEQSSTVIAMQTFQSAGLGFGAEEAAKLKEADANTIVIRDCLLMLLRGWAGLADWSEVMAHVERFAPGALVPTG